MAFHYKYRIALCPVCHGNGWDDFNFEGEVINYIKINREMPDNNFDLGKCMTCDGSGAIFKLI